MFITQIPTAEQARDLVPEGRTEVIKKAILHSISEGSSSCFVRFRATDIEVASLKDLGYKVTVDVGVTHVYWF